MMLLSAQSLPGVVSEEFAKVKSRAPSAGVSGQQENLSVLPVPL